MKEKFYLMRQQMDAAFNIKELETAEALAKEYLTLAAQFPKDWNYGNAIHHANLMLGRIALNKGDVAAAKVFLLQAGQTPGSPQLNSFGPNMSLAEKLLKQGEFEVVLKYIDLTTKFWIFPFRLFKIQKWRKQIKRQMIPDFRAHIFY